MVRSDLPPVVLGAPDVTWDADELAIRCRLGASLSLDLRVRGPRSLLDRVVPRVEPFLPMALLVSGSAARDLAVEAPIDASFLTTLRVAYLPLLRRLFGHPLIEIVARGPTVDGAADPRRTVGLGRPPEPAGLLFSGGVDSFYSMVRLHQVGHPLSLLINVNAGAHGTGRELVDLRFERVCRVASEAALEASLVDTNFHEVLEVPHLHAWPIRNLPAATILHGAVDGLMSSTSRAFHEVSLERVDAYIGNAGAGVVSCLAWSAMPVTEVGYDATRFQKLRLVADDPLAQRHLDVCVDGAYQLAASPRDPVNCGRCAKCAWTILALDRLGRLDAFRDRFDLDGFPGSRAELQEVTEATQRRVDQAIPMEDPAPPVGIRIAPPAGL
jgi:hypothetical protein